MGRKPPQKRGGVCIRVAESLRCRAETNTRLETNYIPILKIYQFWGINTSCSPGFYIFPQSLWFDLTAGNRHDRMPHSLSHLHTHTTSRKQQEDPPLFTLLSIEQVPHEHFQSPLHSQRFAPAPLLGPLVLPPAGGNPFKHIFHVTVQSLSHVQLFVTPVDCSTPGLPVRHQLPEFSQTHVHWVGDAIQPSHPLSSPSPPALNLSQHQGLFQWVSSSHQVTKGLELQLQHQSFQWTFRTAFPQDGLVGSPCSPKDSQESSPTPQFKSINSPALSLLYCPALISMHDYWKNHSFDQTDLCWQSDASAF